MSWEDQQPAPINHSHYASTINVQLCRRRSVTMLYLVTIICIMHHTNRTKPPATCLVIEDGLKACVHGPEQEPGSPMHGLARQTGFSSERYGSMHARAQPLHPTPTLHAPCDQNSKGLFPATVQVQPWICTTRTHQLSSLYFPRSHR